MAGPRFCRAEAGRLPLFAIGSGGALKGYGVVELVAGRYVKAVNRIWGTKVGEISAPPMRDGTFGTRVFAGVPWLHMQK